MKTKLLFTILLMTFATLALSSQSISQIISGAIIETYTFNKDSMGKEFVIEVNKGLARIEIDVNAKVKNGKIVVEIFSPSGNLATDLKLDANREGRYKEEAKRVTIKGNILTKQESDRLRHQINLPNDTVAVNGAIIQSENNPQEGKWVIKMTPEQAEGEVEISYSQK